MCCLVQQPCKSICDKFAFNFFLIPRCLHYLPTSSPEWSGGPKSSYSCFAQAVVGGKVSFSSGSESRDNYQKSGPVEEERSKQKGGGNMRKIFDHRIRYGHMDDGGQSYQNMSEADRQRCKR